jgi:hypothetical protein
MASPEPEEIIVYADDEGNEVPPERATQAERRLYRDGRLVERVQIRVTHIDGVSISRQ